MVIMLTTSPGEAKPEISIRARRASTSLINEMNCVGSLLILIIGLNLMKITKIKVADYLPAIPIAMLLAVFM